MFVSGRRRCVEVHLRFALDARRRHEQTIEAKAERGHVLAVRIEGHVGEPDVHRPDLHAKSVQDGRHHRLKHGGADALHATASPLLRGDLGRRGERCLFQRHRAALCGFGRPFVLRARRRGDGDALEGDDDGVHAEEGRLPRHLQLQERDGALAHGEGKFEVVERIGVQAHVLQTDDAAPKRHAELLPGKVRDVPPEEALETRRYEPLQHDARPAEGIYLRPVARSASAPSPAPPSLVDDREVGRRGDGAPWWRGAGVVEGGVRGIEIGAAR